MKLRKKRKTSSNNNILRAKRLVKGLTIEWESDQPLEAGTPMVNCKVSHTNALMRLTAGSVVQDFGEYITAKQSFLWRVQITVVFRYDNGRDQLEERELLAHTVLSRLNEHTFDAIDDAMRYGDRSKYLTTRFKVECMGDRAPRESDSLIAEAV